MKRLLSTAVFAQFCLASAGALAQNITDAFAGCAVTKDDRQRLACYDKIRDDVVRKYRTSESRAQASGYQEMSLLDLKTDIRSLSGQKVSVLGSLQSCTTFCAKAKINGRVRSGVMGPELAAEQIVWN